MKIEILNSSYQHPVNKYLHQFIEEFKDDNEITLHRNISELTGGKILFLISCEQKIPSVVLRKFQRTLILHASDLPQGRGWSPHIWEILNGSQQITISMIDASEKIDGGCVYQKRKIEIPKSALWDEINDLLFSTEISLMKYAIEHFDKLESVPQDTSINATYYRKRVPRDSELDVKKSIQEQFDLMRICDAERYPAYFELNGQKYKIILESYENV
jgi:methionyl-tRNA formyltransferase